MIKWLHVCIIFSSICSIILFSCGKIENESPPNLGNNPNLVFSNSKELILPVSNGDYKFPVFDLSKIKNNFLYIAVFDEMIQLNNAKDEIFNKENIIWIWDSSMEFNNDSVKYEDGQSTNGSLGCLLSDNPDQIYYWAAWAWDKYGNFIEYSTPVYDFTLQNTVASIDFDKAILITDGNNDGFINRAEKISITVFLKNSGLQSVNNLEATFEGTHIPEFPLIANYGDLLPAQSIGKTITFTTNGGLNYNDVFPVNIILKGDNCYYKVTNLNIRITGRWVCFEQIILDSIANIQWDGDGTPPDIFPTLTSTTSTEAHIGNEVADMFPPLAWDFGCEYLNVQRTYSLSFQDNDLAEWQPPEQIWVFHFKLESYMADAISEIPFQNGQTKARLIVRWH